MAIKRKLLQDLLGDYIYPYTDATAVFFDKTIKNILAAQNVQAALDALTTATMGISTDLTGFVPQIEGTECVRNGAYANTEGYKNLADATTTHVEGGWNTAIGPYDHVGGYQNISLTGYHFNISEFDTALKTIKVPVGAWDTETFVVGARLAIFNPESSAERLTNVRVTAIDEATRTLTLDTAPALNWLGFAIVADLSQAGPMPRHTTGLRNFNCGMSSHVEGSCNLLTGENSHVEGMFNTGTDNSVHVEGAYNHASGYASHAEGYDTHAAGLYSHSQNAGTIAQGMFQTAVGKYNVAQGNPQNSANTDNAFIIGNGSADHARSNALTIAWDGTVDIPAASSAVKIGGYKADVTDPRRLFVEYDFPSGVTGFPGAGAAISSGTATTIPAGEPNHPGCVTLRSSTTANSGYYLALMAATGLRLAGGERFEAIIKTPTAHTNNTIRFGLHDSITTAAPTDGVFMEIVAGVVTAKTRNNSTETADATTYTLATSTWYRLRVLVDTTNSVKLEIADAAGTVLWSRTITTNIPSASGREVGAVLVGTNSGTTAVDLLTLDYLGLEIDRVLAR